MRAIYDGNNFVHGTNRFTHPHTLGNVIEVALRRIPITPNLNPNLVVRHRPPRLHRRECIRKQKQIGGLAGGGKGALIGAALGGGAGTAGAAYTGEKEIVLHAESMLTFKLTEPLTIKK